MNETTESTGVTRWAIVGAGGIADGFARDLRAVRGARLAAVSSRRRENAEAFAARHDVPTVCDDVEALVARPDVDVVYIATPNQRHAHDALHAIRNHKAVLVEKPFTIDASEAHQVVAAAREHEVFCMEAMWMRFIPAIRRAIDLVGDGAIGDLRSVHADFSLVAPYDPDGRLFDPRQGGGALLDLGVYGVALVHMLLGPPGGISATAGFTPSGVDEHVAVTLRHPGGVISSVTAGLRAHGPNSAVIAGTAGTIRLPGPICAPRSLSLETFGSGDAGPGDGGRRRRSARSPRLTRIARTGRASIDRVRRATRRTRVPIDGIGYRYEAEEVMRCLEAGLLESPTLPLEHTEAVMRTLDAIRASWTTST